MIENNFAELFPVSSYRTMDRGMFCIASDTDIELHGVTVFYVLNPDRSFEPVLPALLQRGGQIIDRNREKLSLVLIGSGITADARRFFAYGADRIFVYDDPAYLSANQSLYETVFAHFLKNYKPARILGAKGTAGELLLQLLHQLEPAADEQTPAAAESFSPDPGRTGELILCEVPGVRNYY